MLVRQFVMLIVDVFIIPAFRTCAPQSGHIMRRGWLHSVPISRLFSPDCRTRVFGLFLSAHLRIRPSSVAHAYSALLHTSHHRTASHSLIMLHKLMLCSFCLAIMSFCLAIMVLDARFIHPQLYIHTYFHRVLPFHHPDVSRVLIAYDRLYPAGPSSSLFLSFLSSHFINYRMFCFYGHSTNVELLARDPGNELILEAIPHPLDLKATT